MGLSVPQMALMSRLLDEALPLDAAARRVWLERLSSEYLQHAAVDLRQGARGVNQIQRSSRRSLNPAHSNLRDSGDSHANPASTCL